MLVLTVRDCIKVVTVSCEFFIDCSGCIKVVRVSCECLY